MKATLTRRSLLLAALARAAAQEVTFSTSIDLVTLLATVRNRDGGIVNDLNQDDFVLEEDGRPQTIRYFSRESNVPLTLGLLVDTSRSQLKMLEPERKASYAFLDHMLREGDQSFVASFDIGVHMLQGLTNSRELLSKAFDQLQIPGQVSTLLFDAIHLTSDNLMRKQKRPEGFHPAFRRRRCRQPDHSWRGSRICAARRHLNLFHLVSREVEAMVGSWRSGGYSRARDVSSKGKVRDAAARR